MPAFSPVNIPVMRTPRNVDIAITHRCNLRCRYCSHFTGAGDVQADLPASEWCTFFEELNRCGVMNVILQGGEPFIREDFSVIVDGIVRNRMRFNVLSNGTLITDAMAGHLATSGRCEGVQVSIDGSIPITHDAFRGKGSFYQAIRGIRILQKAEVPVTVRVTIHKNNVHELEAIAELLLDEIGLPAISTNSASYMGLCRQNAEQVQLTVEERTLAMATLVELNRKYGGRISATAGPLADAGTWREMMDQTDGQDSGKAEPACLSACGGPFNTLGVRADGVMVPCTQLGHIALGRINRDGLKEVWQTHPELDRLRRRFHIPLSDFSFCNGCQYISHCTGNCPALAYTITGEENHPSPDACLKRFLEDGGKLPKTG